MRDEEERQGEEGEKVERRVAMKENKEVVGKVRKNIEERNLRRHQSDRKQDEEYAPIHRPLTFSSESTRVMMMMMMMMIMM